jgi:hypothetical protein
MRVVSFAIFLGVTLIACAAGVASAQVPAVDPQQMVIAQAAVVAVAPAGKEIEPSPEERMRRRHPQPVKVGDLIGLPVLDWSDSTIGFVRRVVRTPDGKIQLVVNHGRVLGWGGRLVPVPIEAVAILGRQIAALDMTREQFGTAPAWSDANGRDIPPGEMIQIAITRR